jgi:hypothetical protein
VRTLEEAVEIYEQSQFKIIYPWQRRFHARHRFAGDNELSDPADFAVESDQYGLWFFLQRFFPGYDYNGVS